ncbi:MAG: ABC transporter substrate-binding protein [Gallionella sp.]
MKKLLPLFLLLLLVACDGGNSPYPSAAASNATLYTAFTERPKHLDPAQAYSENEYEFLAQIYAPPLQYHYLKRPYQLVPLAASAMPRVTFLDAQQRVLPSDADTQKIAYSVYEIHLRDDMRYQAHPAFVQAQQDLTDIKRVTDFAQTGTRKVTAADYVYQLKRLAHPALHVPIAGVMSDYIVGFKDYAAQLQQHAAKHPNEFLDVRQFDFAGAQVVDEQTYRITIKGKYPQFEYWLAMPFFAPMPFEAEQFYARAGMRERNLSLDWWPVGSGPFYLSEYNPNQRMVLSKNPNYMAENYPELGEAGDAAAGYLSDAGKRLPLLDEVIFSLEKETIPYWNKFLQGYYDASGISSDSFDQAVQVSGGGETSVTDSMQAQGISLSTAVETSTMYTGFNWLDATVGGDCTSAPPIQLSPASGRKGERRESSCDPERARKLRQAIAIAVDFEEFVSIFANGRGIAAMSPIPPGIFGYQDGAAGINPVVYDWLDGKAVRKPIAEARRLLAEAGYPDGIDALTHQPLVINLDTTANGVGNKSRLDWMRKQFEKIKVQLVVRSTDYNRFQDKIRRGDMQMFYYGWNADYPDPENFLFLLNGAQAKVAKGGENAANYRNAEFDRLFEQMKNMDNTPQRQKIITQMLAIIQRDSPWLWGHHPKKYVLQHQWLHNVKPNVMANNKLKYWRVDGALREQLRNAWNHPVLWPLGLAGLALLGLVGWLWWVLKRREQAKN